ncbi:MAG: glycogen synthase [Solirubrobacteraceae bacterium]|jgi:glycosyltransferase involved in cell wall biosynthesis|nr:glycogen synthase [Solirubrobacteraceae bacterium]
MPRVLMGLMFFPRGGSAHVTRALARALPAQGWDVTIASGSLRGGHADAQRFFSGLDVRPMDYTEAIAAADPLAHDPPMHPSFEDRDGAADRVFAKVDDAGFERLVDAWSDALEAAGAADADVIHLNHLTPMHAAAARVAPGVPIVTHVHGTELLMLEAIASGPPRDWDHAEAWSARLRRWGRASQRLILLSSTQEERVERELGIAPEACSVVPNGFDPEVFDRRAIDRMKLWRRWLVENPQGWRPGGDAGSVAYEERDLAAFEDDVPVLLYVGRYTRVKRIGVLIRAYRRARERFDRPAPLVLLGGFPGEWEGEHPVDVVESCGLEREVFLAGWHDHDLLPDFFAASDAVVLPSVREQFGQVLVEGMACGLPAIAVDAHGPGQIVDDGETGWLVEPDDEEALADALVAAVNDPAERRRRGEAARRTVRAKYAWPALAERVADIYRDVSDSG